MATAKQNLVIDQGSTFSQQIVLTNVNNEPYNVANTTVSSQIRKNYMSSNSVAFSTVLQDGVLTLGLTVLQTSALIPGRYMYDVLLITPTETNRIIEGIVTVTPAVTR